MASVDTGYVDSKSFWQDSNGKINGYFRLTGTVTRSNNTVSFTSLGAYMRLARTSGFITSIYWASGSWWTRIRIIRNSTIRKTISLGPGNYTVNPTNTTSKRGVSSFSLTVGATATSVTANVEGSSLGDPTSSTNITISIPALGTPTLNSHSATGVTENSAAINYSASAGTNGTFSSCQLQWGLTTSYGNTSSKSTASGTFSLSELEADTTYHYRFVLTNGGGRTTTSSDYTFTTLETPVTNQGNMLVAMMGLK